MTTIRVGLEGQKSEELSFRKPFTDITTTDIRGELGKVRIMGWVDITEEKQQERKNLIQAAKSSKLALGQISQGRRYIIRRMGDNVWFIVDKKRQIKYDVYYNPRIGKWDISADNLAKRLEWEKE